MMAVSTQLCPHQPSVHTVLPRPLSWLSAQGFSLHWAAALRHRDCVKLPLRLCLCPPLQPRTESQRLFSYDNQPAWFSKPRCLQGPGLCR